MTTKTQFATKAKADNPKPQYKTINGAQIELTDEEYETSIEALATMLFEQQAAQVEAQNKAAAKQAVLDKLGLTADEAAALFGQFGIANRVDGLRNHTRQHVDSQITRQKHDVKQLQRA